MIFSDIDKFKEYMASDFRETQMMDALAKASKIMTVEPHVQSFVYSDSVDSL